MKSENSWWQKAIGLLRNFPRGLFKNKRSLIIAVAGFLLILAAVFLLSRIHRKEKITFYPLSENPKVKPAIHLFFQKDYLNLTSYVEQMQSVLYGTDLGLILFYKAEAYFLQNKLQEAWYLFFSLSRTQPQLWQAPFRLGCIHLLRKEMADAGNLILSTHEETEEVYFWKGKYFYEEDKKKEALEMFQRVTYAEALYLSAEILKESGKTREALAAYRLLWERHPQYESKIVLENLIRILEQGKQYQELLKYLDHYEKMFPYDLSIKIKKGQTLHALGRKKEAYGILSSPSLPKKDPLVVKILSDCAFSLGLYAEAVVYFEALEKLSVEEKKNYIESLMKIYEFQKAAVLLKNYLEKEKIETKEEFSRIARQLIECHLQLAQLDEAMKVNVLLLSVEDSAENYMTLSQIYKQMGKPADALAALRKASEKEPKMVQKLIEGLMEAGSLNDALDLTEKILKKDPYHEEALFLKARIYLHQRRIDDAKIPLYTLVYLPPKEPRIEEKSLYLLVTLLMNDGKNQEAENFLDRLLKLNPENQEAALKKAWILLGRGNLEEARLRLQNLKNQAGGNKEFLSRVYYYLSLAEWKERKYDQARYYARQSLEQDRENSEALKILKSME